MNSKISTIEAIMLVLSIFFSHIIVSLPNSLINTTKNATIINLIYIGIIAIFICYIIYKLLKAFPSTDIIDISDFLGGKIFKNIIGMLFIFYFVFTSSILIRNFCECLKIIYYPLTNIIFIILMFIITSIISNHFYLSTYAKASTIIIPIVFFSIIFLFFSNSGNYSFENIFPIFGESATTTFLTGLGNLGTLGGIALLYFIPPHLKEPDKMKKISLITIVLAIIYIIFSVSIILLMFSSSKDIITFLPLYSATRYIEFGSFFQRLESIFLLIWLFEIACYFAVSIKISQNIFQKLTHLKDSKPLIYSFNLLAFGITLIPENFASTIELETDFYKTLVISLVFITSIGILLLANLKKKHLNKIQNHTEVLNE